MRSLGACIDSRFFSQLPPMNLYSLRRLHICIGFRTVRRKKLNSTIHRRQLIVDIVQFYAVFQASEPLAQKFKPHYFS
jgi:hypothetical protein